MINTTSIMLVIGAPIAAVAIIIALVWLYRHALPKSKPAPLLPSSSSSSSTISSTPPASSSSTSSSSSSTNTPTNGLMGHNHGSGHDDHIDDRIESVDHRAAQVRALSRSEMILQAEIEAAQADLSALKRDLKHQRILKAAIARRLDADQLLANRQALQRGDPLPFPHVAANHGHGHDDGDMEHGILHDRSASKTNNIPMMSNGHISLKMRSSLSSSSGLLSRDSGVSDTESDGHGSLPSPTTLPNDLAELLPLMLLPDSHHRRRHHDGYGMVSDDENQPSPDPNTNHPANGNNNGSDKAGRRLRQRDKRSVTSLSSRQQQQRVSGRNRSRRGHSSLTPNSDNDSDNDHNHDDIKDDDNDSPSSRRSSRRALHIGTPTNLTNSCHAPRSSRSVNGRSSSSSHHVSHTRRASSTKHSSRSAPIRTIRPSLSSLSDDSGWESSTSSTLGYNLSQ